MKANVFVENYSIFKHVICSFAVMIHADLYEELLA
jgi:hypothetical protein